MPDIGFLVDRVWGFFSLSTLNISTHCLQTAKISNEKSADNLTGEPLYVTSHFSLTIFKILFVSAFNNLLIMYLGVGIFSSFYLGFVELLGY